MGDSTAMPAGVAEKPVHPEVQRGESAAERSWQ
jgi:hypothetical protein